MLSLQRATGHTKYMAEGLPMQVPRPGALTPPPAPFCRLDSMRESSHEHNFLLCILLHLFAIAVVVPLGRGALTLCLVD